NVRDIDNVERQTAWNYASPIRNRAMLLLALLDTSPNDPRIPSLVDRLTRDLAADPWWSTQDCSFTLIALGQLVRGQHAIGPYEGTVLVDGKSIGDFTSKTIAFRHIRGRNIEVKMRGGYKACGAYYSMTTSGVRTMQSFHPQNAGIAVTRELLTRDGAPIDSKGVHQGDLLVCRVTVQSTNGVMKNVVLQNLIPSGLEVENPRLKSSESFTWISGQMSEC